MITQHGCKGLIDVRFWPIAGHLRNKPISAPAAKQPTFFELADSEKSLTEISGFHT